MITSFKGNITRLYEQEVPVNTCPEINACSIMGEFREIRMLRRAKKDPGTSVQKLQLLKVSVFPCLENSLRTTTLPVPHPASASTQSSWPSCKGGDLPIASRKMQFVANILFGDEKGIHKGTVL
jgi:hypothetical protein